MNTMLRLGLVGVVLFAFAAATVACATETVPESKGSSASHEEEAVKDPAFTEDDVPPAASPPQENASTDPTTNENATTNKSAEDIIAEAHEKFPDSSCWNIGAHWWNGNKGSYMPCGTNGDLCCPISP